MRGPIDLFVVGANKLFGDPVSLSVPLRNTPIMSGGEVALSDSGTQYVASGEYIAQGDVRQLNAPGGTINSKEELRSMVVMNTL